MAQPLTLLLADRRDGIDLEIGATDIGDGVVEVDLHDWRGVKGETRRLAIRLEADQVATLAKALLDHLLRYAVS